jgi:hypothetical protein
MLRLVEDDTAAVQAGPGPALQARRFPVDKKAPKNTLSGLTKEERRP